MRRYLWILIAALALFVILFGSTAVRLYVDWLWFNDLGYPVVFWKIIQARTALALVFAAVFFAIVYSNLRIARRLAPPLTRRYGGIEDELRERLGALARKGLGAVLLAGSAVVALMAGLQAATRWDEWLKFANATPFGVKDPLFGLDLSFYVFRLPFWDYLYGWFFFALFAAAVASALLHYAYEGIEFFANTPRFAPGVKTHLAILLALLFFLKAVGYKLGMYKLVLSSGGLFYGAGYTDVHARLPVLWILLVAAAVAGVVVLLNIYRRGIWYAAGALIGLVGLSIVAGAIYPAIVEQFIVKPNELDKQRPYVKHAIGYTRRGFGIDAIETRPFKYTTGLTPQQIANNRAVIQNLRLWDYDPLKRAYRQLQELQQYYSFRDVDIDRYMIDGTYRQVMLSAREITGPPSNAQASWINEYLRYTHGYGYVMSPVNEVGAEGMPVFFAKDIPPVTREGLKVEVPQIYFGEITDQQVYVDTRQNEFDYPVAGQDQENVYDADSGVRIGSIFRKLILAVRFADEKILLSADLRPSSRVLFRRNIAERAQALFPFLALDNDPYLFTANGRLYWLHDAYTTTNRHPYSQPVGFQFKGLGEIRANYIRNSVKLVTDAYTGEVQAFVADAGDPIIRTYARIFPGVFKPMEQMPEEFISHIRYPEDLFKIQAHVYSRYHMTDPSAFYGQTDLWQIPEVQRGEQGEGMMEPYYIITRLPNSSVDEFILIVPLVRPEKHNMVAWMAARCDPEDYGKLIVYEFPRGERVFGPRQIMARADQDTQISQQLTLWGQLGSKVVRGNLLAIPIENTILYVEPLYLESTTTQIPEFKRVIVALGDRVVMEPTLEEALAMVVGVDRLPAVAEVAGPRTAVPPAARPAVPEVERAPGPDAAPTADVRELAGRAREQFERAQELQRRGDWAGYGRELDSLRRTISEIERAAGGR